jgi:hypothetical protein
MYRILQTVQIRTNGKVARAGILQSRLADSNRRRAFDPFEREKGRGTIARTCGAVEAPLCARRVFFVPGPRGSLDQGDERSESRVARVGQTARLCCGAAQDRQAEPRARVAPRLIPDVPPTIGATSSATALAASRATRPAGLRALIPVQPFAFRRRVVGANESSRPKRRPTSYEPFRNQTASLGGHPLRRATAR